MNPFLTTKKFAFYQPVFNYVIFNLYLFQWSSLVKQRI